MHTYVEAKQNLFDLIQSLPSNSDMNEAQTRFHLIDAILKNSLNWETWIEVEQYEDGQFSDYHLGSPATVVLEAKREGVFFAIPAGYSQKRVIDLESFMSFSEINNKAIRQVQQYCSSNGISIAILCNGSQFIIFLGSRTDGTPVFKGNAVIFHSLNDLYQNFELVWNLMSFDGVQEKNIYSYLKSEIKGIPKKLSADLLKYPKARYANDLQTNLRSLSQIFIQDILESDEKEEEFVKNCYCESGELEQFSLLSKDLLQKRYSSLFQDTVNSPIVLPVNSKKGHNLTQETVADSISRRPIVLLGDVGVGKTSFLKNLILNKANNEFKESLSIYINLGSEASLTHNLRDYMLDEIERQLLKKYDIGVLDERLIKGIYASEIVTFDRSFKGSLKNTDNGKYNEELIKYLEKLVEIKDQHFKRLIDYYSKSTKKQFILIIDNADQRTYEVQEEAFIISQEFAKSWKALVFIAVRPNTFYRSQRAGTFSAYPHRIFTIQPPRIDKIIEKRLKFALGIAKGEIPLEGNNLLNTENLKLFIKALLESLQKNKEIYDFLANITGGNIRQSIELVVNFIGSPNVDCNKIIEIMRKDDFYFIPLHEFTKSALLGDYGHFHPNYSISLDLFDVAYPKVEDHFLKPFILAFMMADTKQADTNLFFSTQSIFDELQSMGFTTLSIEESLRVLTNKKLIETAQRVTFEEDEQGYLFGSIPDKFRITSIGAYHIKKWIGTFTYLDAMVFDTPIFDKALQEDLRKKIESFEIEDRFERATKFKKYLLNVWISNNFESNYFSFPALLESESETFSSVENVVIKKK